MMPLSAFIYDAVDVPAIPLTAEVVGMYVDPPPWINTELAVRARFPRATLVSITASGVAGARMGDSETGDMGPAELAAWDASELMALRVPANYCSIDHVPEVVAELERILINPVMVDWFPADWTGVPHFADLGGLPVVGTQYANPKFTGGNFDLSIVSIQWLNRAPLPKGIRPEMITSEVLDDGTVVLYVVNPTTLDVTGYARDAKDGTWLTYNITADAKPGVIAPPAV